MFELRRDFGSHLTASLRGWDFAAGYGEVMQAITAAVTLNANRDPVKQPKPFVVPMPWDGAGTDEEPATEEELAEARRVMHERSALGDR